MSDNSSGISIDYRKLAAACRVEPGTTVDLEHNFDPGRADHRLGKQGAEIALEQAKQELFALQAKLEVALGSWSASRGIRVAARREPTPVGPIDMSRKTLDMRRRSGVAFRD